MSVVQTTNNFGEFILVADSDHYLDEREKRIPSSTFTSMWYAQMPSWTGINKLLLCMDTSSYLKEEN